MTFFAFRLKKQYSVPHQQNAFFWCPKQKSVSLMCIKNRRQYFTYFAYTYVYSRSPVFCSNIHTQRMKKVHSKHIQEIHFLKLHSCVCAYLFILSRSCIM